MDQVVVVVVVVVRGLEGENRRRHYLNIDSSFASFLASMQSQNRRSRRGFGGID
jgi:hypothetical protein